jgi:hypothetical protein
MEAAGNGEALDAAVETAETADQDSSQEDPQITREAELAALRAKVERQKEHLAGAEAALAAAEKEG